MLSSIKTGKKKKKKDKNPVIGMVDRSGEQQQRKLPPTNDHESNRPVDVQAGGIQMYSRDDGSRNTNSSSSSNNEANNDIAERLRLALASGSALPSNIRQSSPSQQHQQSAREQSLYKASTSSDGNNADDNIVVLPQTSFLPTIGGQSGMKQPKREADMTVIELAARERSTASSHNTMSWDEAMTRNVIRTGKKRKMKISSGGGQDSDEEVERMKRHLPGYEEDQLRNGDESTSAITQQQSASLERKLEQRREKEEERTRRRQIDQYKKEQSIVSKCFWWVQSSNFADKRLISFGNHVALMMAPLNASLIPGHHFYIVPIKHATSFVECTDASEVWEEVRLFRQSLENVYARDRKGIVMLETVLPSKGNTGFWQTKMEVVPVPFSALHDAPLYFKSSMTEQSEEWGTHNKILSTSKEKPLPSVIPAGFPYFACNWDHLATSRNATGYAQIIESSSFRHDFGLDTLASMMELDPVRFQRKRNFPKDMERQVLEEFLSKWKKFDWTNNLTKQS